MKSIPVYIYELRRQLDMSLHQTDYGLSILETEGTVFSENDGFFKRYYPISMMNKPKPVTLSPSKRKIADCIRRNPGVTTWEMAEQFLQSPESIYRHLRRLCDGGFVRRKIVKGRYEFDSTKKQYL